MGRGPKRYCVIFSRPDTDPRTAAQTDDLKRWSLAQRTDTFRHIKWVTDVYAVSSRPGIKVVDAMIKDDTIAALVVWRLDRLAMNLERMHALLSRLKSAGARFISVMDDIDTGKPSGEMFFRILKVCADTIHIYIDESTAMHKNRGRRSKLTQAIQNNILDLHQQGLDMHSIRLKLCLTRYAVRHAFIRLGLPIPDIDGRRKSPVPLTRAQRVIRKRKRQRQYTLYLGQSEPRTAAPPSDSLPQSEYLPTF